MTTNPPTMLIVPNAIAITSNTCSNQPTASCINNSPPSSTTPWIAFVPDINGVCSVFGTFEITSNPTNAASTRIAISVIVLTLSPPPDRDQEPAVVAASAAARAASWTISPSRVMQAPAITSSSKSSAS